MKFSRLALLAVALLGFAFPARADTYTNLTYPSAVWDSTTGKLYALGIPGKGQAGQTIIPNSGTANTWSGVSNFTGPFEVNGVTFTWPSTGGKVATAAGPAPTACGASCTVSTSNDLTLLNQVSGSTATLGGANGTGIVHKFRISAALTSAADKILTNPTTDAIIGTATGENAGTVKAFVGNAGTYHSIQIPFAGTQPSGGFIGDQITCTDIAVGIWACDMTYQAGTTPTTPYSASTS